MFRYRQLDPDGDMTFGRGALNFLFDSPAAVAQAVQTRLNLWQGEWFLNLAEGTPWRQQILGKPRGPGSPDAALRQRILGTPFVTQITEYVSLYNSADRSWTVSCKVFTSFGPVTTSAAEAAGLTTAPSGATVFRLTPPQPAQPQLAAPSRRLAAR